MWAKPAEGVEHYMGTKPWDPPDMELTLQRGMLHGRPRRVLRRASRSSPDRARAAAAAAASAPSDGTFTPQAKLPASALAELQPPKLGRNGHGSATPAPASVSLQSTSAASSGTGSAGRGSVASSRDSRRVLTHDASGIALWQRENFPALANVSCPRTPSKSISQTERP